MLRELAFRAPDAFEQKSDVITAFLLKKVLMTQSSSNAVSLLHLLHENTGINIYGLIKDTMDVDEEWVEDQDMSPELNAKILSLKVLRSRCLAHASSEVALEIAKPVISMFTTLLQNSGSFSEDIKHECVFGWKLKPCTLAD